MSTKTTHTFGTRLAAPIEVLRPLVEEALRAEGFGVLTEIDVAATLKSRLGISRPGYLILGACNPQLAHRALEAEPSVGAILPCNVVLREDQHGTVVEALDPEAAMSMVGSAEVAAVARDARRRLLRVIEAVERAGAE